MKIIHTAIEFAPVIKAGGLGDALYGLAKALADKHTTEVVLPLYPKLFPSLHEQDLCAVQKLSYFFAGEQEATAFSYFYEGIKITLLKLDTQPELFEEAKTIYSDDDAFRFCAFSSAAASYIQKEGANIVHLHDWHVGLVAGLLKQQPCPQLQKIVLTLHNFGYRGYTTRKVLEASSLNEFYLNHYQLFRDPQICVLLKGALYCSDFVTTVSPTYAKEILQDYSDYEIHDAITARQHHLRGILNGIDTAIWGPETDPNLAENYNKNLFENPKIFFEAKAKNKVALYETLGLSLDNNPCVCIISRIAEQKGPEFMKQAILHALEHAYTLVIIGTCYGNQLQKEFSNLQQSLANSPNVRILLTYSDILARQIFAAADMICIPSIFEPCGLTQMIGMRYGTVPLVRATGGLADTVTHGVNGFSFSNSHDFQEFRNMLSAAINAYRNHQDRWQQIVRACLEFSSDLKSAANQYLEIYKQ
ncbi:glycogen synthase GlgA [Chlamydia sp.]|uniref:glycogen synthase GlgA n=1 Tax=Chlamydia sp. TaxID=35827 RepID=UPI0025C1A2F3|nr:glycogen synthase GlgA [Chlamydia sp.]MBQ8498557.1 glycogen synthase GlgA [Chlamydia sp.]